MSKEIRTFKTPEEVAEEAAKRFVQLAQTAIATQNRFSAVLAGGNTPKILHQLLAQTPLKEPVDWRKVHVFFGDERFVPPDDPGSNLLMAKKSLLDHVPIPRENIHPMQTLNISPEQAAQQYEETIKNFFAGANLSFDLVYLGLGEDGHTASLFPNHQAMSYAPDRLVAVVKNSPKPPSVRLTLTYKAINQAKNVIFLATGENKAQAVARALKEADSSHPLPVQSIQPEKGHLLWLLDEAAARCMS